MPVVKPYIDWTSYDQATQPYQEELTSTQIISKQRVFDLDTEPCFFETPINGQQTNKIQPKKRLQILRTPSPELYNDRSIARSPDLRDESLDDAYCLNPTIVLESEKRKSSKKLISHEINAKIDARNQIFCSSDDESDDERFNKSDTPKTPKRIRNITLRLSQVNIKDYKL